MEYMNFELPASILDATSTQELYLLLLIDLTLDIFFITDIYLRSSKFFNEDIKEKAVSLSMSNELYNPNKLNNNNDHISGVSGVKNSNNPLPLSLFTTHENKASSGYLNHNANVRRRTVIQQKHHQQIINNNMHNNTIQHNIEKAYFQSLLKQVIRKEYLSSSKFLLDLLGSLPFATISTLILIYSSNKNTQAIFLLLRLFRFFRIHRLLSYFTELEEGLEKHSKNNNPLFLRIVQYFLLIMLLAHFAACIWLYIGYIGAKLSETGWMYLTSSPKNHLNNSFTSFYITAVYFIMVSIATIGYGDIQPTSPADHLDTNHTFSTTAETIFVCLLSIIGVVLYSTITANLAALASSIGASLARENYQQGLLAKINHYLNSFKQQANEKRTNIFKYESQLKIKHILSTYAVNIWNIGKGVEEDVILNSLPYTLKRHLLTELFLPLLSSSYLFGHKFTKEMIKDGLDQTQDIYITQLWLIELCNLISIRSAAKQEIVKKVDDIANCLLIVLSGSLLLVDDELIEGKLREGHIYGHKFISFESLYQANLNNRHKFDLIAKTDIQYGIIKLDDIYQLCNKYPLLYQRLAIRWKTLFISNGQKNSIINAIQSIKEEQATSLIKQSTFISHDSYSHTFSSNTTIHKKSSNNNLQVSNTHFLLQSVHTQRELIHQKINGLFIAYDSQFLIQWEYIGLLFLILYIILYPISFSYAYYQSSKMLLHSCLIIFFIIDLYFLINTFLEFQYIVTDTLEQQIESLENLSTTIIKQEKLKKINQYYSSTILNWLRYIILDLSSYFPFTLFLFILYLTKVISLSSFYQYSLILKANSILLVIISFRKYFKRLIKIFEMISISYRIRRITLICLLVIILLHWCASLWLLIGKSNETFATNWLQSKANITSKLSSQYLYSYYFTFVTITTAGYGDIVPQNFIEIIFVLCFILLSTCLYGGIIGSVAVQMANFYKTHHMNMFIDMYLDLYAGLKSLSTNLYRELWRYNNEVEQQINFIDTKKLIQQLPTHISTLVASYKFEDAILDPPLFNSVSDDLCFINSLCLLFHEEIYLPGECLIRLNHINTKLFIILKGKVTVNLYNIKTLKVIKKISLIAPFHFGEITFFNGTISKSSVFCNSIVNTLILSIHQLRRLLKDYPGYEELILNEIDASELITDQNDDQYNVEQQNDPNITFDYLTKLLVDNKKSNKIQQQAKKTSISSSKSKSKKKRNK